VNADQVAPDLIEPVVGFRRWRLSGDRLLSPFVDIPWDGEPIRARCLGDAPRVRHTGRDHHEPAPAPDCVCGIYSYFRPLSSWVQPWAEAGPVAGAVVLWGRIEVHETGMRAEWAKPVALALMPASAGRRRQAIRRAAARIGIDAVPLSELRGAALRYGRPLPAALRPAA